MVEGYISGSKNVGPSEAFRSHKFVGLFWVFLQFPDKAGFLPKKNEKDGFHLRRIRI